MADPQLPTHLFADQEEHAGDRVNMYFKLNTIKVVLKALQPKELDIIRPCFGKLLDVYSKPVFSGKFAHFLLTRQLDVVKRHEIWVVFAGKPVRFSLREFGLVTGLNCGPLPALDRTLVKCPPGVTPYWFTLFGGEESFTGEMLLAKLCRAKSLTSELRIKYACLLLVDGFLCRRSFHMKIPKEHMEMIRDLDVFLKYPWSLYSFDMTMQCIKSRSLNQLAQATVAIQGFIHALVLVLVEAVPAVRSAVGEITDPESGDEDVFPVISLKLDKVWDLDKETKVEVDVLSIIPAPEDVVGLEDCSWADKVRDPGVELILQKIEEGAKFNRGMFLGEYRGAYVHVEPPPSEVKKGKRKVRSQSGRVSSKSKKLKVRSGRSRHTPSDQNSAAFLASVKSEIEAGMKEARGDLFAHVAVELKSMELRLEKSFKYSICSAVTDALQAKNVVQKIIEEVGVDIPDPYQQPPPNGSANPGRSSVTQQKKPAGATNLDASSEEVDGSTSRDEDSSSSQTNEELSTVVAEAGEVSSGGNDLVEAVEFASSAKFKKLVDLLTPTIELDFGDGLVLNEFEMRAVATSIPPDNPKVMDVCVSVLRESLFKSVDPTTDPRADMLPCKFNGSLALMYSKFKKCRRKDTFEFDADLLSSVTARFTSHGRKWLESIDFLYSPFNIDKNRWIAVMVDLPSHSLSLFDSTADVRRGSRLKPELDFICDMFPYLVRKLGANDLMTSYPLHPLAFVRHTTVAQATARANTGMLSILFMEAHALGGFEELDRVNESGVRERAEQLAVELYEYCCGDIEEE
ncbi:unnamed protein product [Arabidopsis lyrata]|nr:unnamed protein product [Arabidopsis lyrata]